MKDSVFLALPDSASQAYIWRPPILSELTPMIFNVGLTYIGSEPSICEIKISIHIINCKLVSCKDKIGKKKN